MTQPQEPERRPRHAKRDSSGGVSPRSEQPHQSSRSEQRHQSPGPGQVHEVSRQEGPKVKSWRSHDLQLTFAEFQLGGEERELRIPEESAVRRHQETEAAMQENEAALREPEEFMGDSQEAFTGQLTLAELDFGPSGEQPSGAASHAGHALTRPTPPSPEVSTLPASSVPPSFDGARYYTREQQFYLRAKELEWHAEPQAPFTPFKSYWPVYSEMSPPQERWYFYWREEVRSGSYPDTDLSYLFLYIYELIHGIGWSGPQQGWQLLNQVWLAYRGRYRKLDSYLREWRFDFARVHGLELPEADVLDKLPRSLSPELREREWLRRFSARPVELNWDVLRELLDVDPEKSRFFQESGSKALKTYAPKVIALADAYGEKTGAGRLLERFRPPEINSERPLFRTAVYDESLFGRTVTVRYMKLSAYSPLRAFLTQLVRLTENVLRELMHFKGRLKGVSVEPELGKLIRRYLEKELGAGVKAPQPPAPVVTIDPDKLQRLQQESDLVRDLLMVEEPEYEDQRSPAPDESESFAGAAPVPPSWDNTADGGIHWNTEQLGQEWQELALRLTPPQLEMLYALKHNLGPAARQAAAERAGSMPELLLDEINEAAMEWIGDLLIDGDALLEDYADMLDFTKR
ncbi:TerB N-terminal domain-containing protein [Paenibacillus sp. F411]|uniref:TerB N-terminal domain-containing protein n=1 Tax=Paenibacillus sp. F411 TaxID=2820239 RepID=UPI001AAFCAE3|nr:TerB N-terminal domain-containing protein [Paenibacillus sp. F411]